MCAALKVETVMGLYRTAATAANGLASVMVGRRPIFRIAAHPKFVFGAVEANYAIL